MQVEVSNPEASLAALVDRAEQGEEVLLMRSGRAIFKLVPVDTESGKSSARKPLLGAAKGEINFSDDWDCPEKNAEIADLFLKSHPLPGSPAE